MAGDHDEAQDLLQDAVVEAYRAFASFRQGTYFDRWLYRIMTRTFIDRQRSRKRVKIQSLDAHRGEWSDAEYLGTTVDVADSESDPSNMIERDIMAEPVERALASLAPDFRMVLILADIEEMSYEQISAVLDCPVGTVRSRLHRARQQVKGCLVKSGYIR
jgi:RNA polymerase sigma-70 factor (ECF subfamily)